MSEEMNIGELLSDQLGHLLAKSPLRDVLITTEQGVLPRDLWQTVEEMGVPLALAKESAGGAGLCWQDAESIFRTLGEYAAPMPLGETMIGLWALGQAGCEELPIGTLAIATEIFALDNDDLITGTDALVPWLEQADHLVLIAKREHELFICLLESKGLTKQTLTTLGRIPSALLRVNNVRALKVLPINKLADLGLLPIVATLRVLQMSGALNRILSLCVEYANTRKQFGRLIGKFQAIQHMLADLAIQSAAAQAAALYACRCLDRGDAEQGASVAKSQVSKVAGTAAAIAHQVFGAIGVTDEHELHYYTRRLWQWRTEAGSEYFWSERLGHKVLDETNEALWATIAG